MLTQFGQLNPRFMCAGIVRSEITINYVQISVFLENFKVDLAFIHTITVRSKIKICHNFEEKILNNLSVFV